MKLFLLFINLLKFTYQIINIPFKRTESNQFKVFFFFFSPKVCDFLYLSFFERNIELYRKFSYFPEDSTSSHYIDTEEDIYEDIAVFADYDAYKPVMNHFQCRIINKLAFYILFNRFNSNKELTIYFFNYTIPYEMLYSFFPQS